MIHIYPYGLLVTFCSLLAYFVAWINKSFSRVSRKTYSKYLLLTTALGFILSRLLYCLCLSDYLVSTGDFAAVIRFSDGGYTLYGMLGGWLLAALITAKTDHVSFRELADSLTIPICVFIMYIRLNGWMFNQGLGMNLKSWFDPEETDPFYRYSIFRISKYSLFMHFPLSVKNTNGIWCWNIGILEALTALALILFLGKVKGKRTVAFLLLYSASQIVWEAMLRGDVLYLPYLGFVKANQVFAAVTILVVSLVCIKFTDVTHRKSYIITFIITYLTGALLVVTMEFAAFEKKITAIAFMPVEVCHIILAIGAMLMIFAPAHEFLNLKNLRNNSQTSLIEKGGT